MGVVVFLVVVAALGLFLSWAFELQTSVLPSQEPAAQQKNLPEPAFKSKRQTLKVQRSQALNAQ